MTTPRVAGLLQSAFARDFDEVVYPCAGVFAC